MPSDPVDWPKVAKKFFENLEDEGRELDLFCTLATFATLQPNPSRFDKFRDWFFTFLRGHRDTFHDWFVTSIRGRKWMANRSPSKTDDWRTRLQDWEQHLNVYLWISLGCSNPSQMTPTQYIEKVQGERIKLLSDHLKILDGKFSMLLTVNSVLAALVGVSLRETADLFGKITPLETTGVFWLKWSVFLIIVSLLVWVIIRCLFNIWFAIKGFRRVVWGDLSDCHEPSLGENELSRFLIISLARRTNMFRIVSASTRRAYRCFVVFAVVALLTLLYVSYRNARSDYDEIGHRACSFSCLDRKSGQEDHL
jgi:hypothetical protein